MTQRSSISSITNEPRYQTLRHMYDEVNFERRIATDDAVREILDRRCDRLARDMDDYVRGRLNAEGLR